MRLVYVWNTILRLPRDDGEIEERRCPIHGEVMAVEIVPIEARRASTCDGGNDDATCLRKLAWEKAYHEAGNQLFPESNRTAWSRYGDLFTKEEVHFCQACRDPEQLWLDTHPQPEQ